MEFTNYIKEQAEIAQKACHGDTFGSFAQEPLLEFASCFALESDPDIADELEETKSNLKRLKRLFIPSVLILIALVIAGGAYLGFIGSGIGLLVWYLGFTALISLPKEILEKHLRHGQTLEESGRCIRMKGFIEESPTVANYVRTVTSHRQLYFFDYIVAYGLKMHEETLNKKNEEIKKNREACLAIHSGKF